MSVKTTLLLPGLLLTACTSADPWRHFPDQTRSQPVLAPQRQGADAHAQPSPSTGAAAPAKETRRAVPAQIVRMPPSPPPPPAVPAPSLPPASAASGPQPIIHCDGLICSTPDGRVQGGTGSVHLDPGGRPCHASGGWLQCF